MAGKIELKAPLDGVVTIEPEDTASNFTVIIPAVTSTLVNEASDITAQVKTATNATGDAPIFSCRAWCNFDGTGTVAIRASGNVTGITDNGTGDYTVNFTTAMPDANYCASVDSDSQQEEGWTVSSSSIRFLITNSSGALKDTSIISVAVFR